MPAGADVLPFAIRKIGQRYVNRLVPKDDPNWDGPWDCAEFTSWLVYQAYGILYGTDRRNTNPHTTEAYTGFWSDDAQRLGKMISVGEAARIPGAFLLKVPPRSGAMGHVAVSDGAGGTIEAMGARFGVCRGRAQGRAWNFGILIPGVDYNETAVPPPTSTPSGPGPLPPPNTPLPDEPVLILRRRTPMRPDERVKVMQQALQSAGYDPGPIDGEFGPITEEAVIEFQQAKGLFVDGEVGPETGRALGLQFWAAGTTLPPSMEQPESLPTEPPTRQEATETRPVNPSITFEDIKDEYIKLWDTMTIREEKLTQIDRLIDRIVEGRSRYLDVVGDFDGLPWWFLGVLHAMESGVNFKTHLHNGDPLTDRTVNDPPRRPPIWDPRWPWEKSAQDAVVYDGLNRWTDWSLAGALYKLERYNGMGPRRRFGRASAYLWSYSNHYVAGKYAADRVWDPDLVSKQCGAAVLMKRMVSRRVMARPRD